MPEKEIIPEEKAEEPQAVPVGVPAPESAPEIPTPEAAAEIAMPEAAPEILMPEAPFAPVAPASGSWPAKDSTDNDRLMAGLAYATQVIVPIVVPAVMLLAEESKKRPFQRFHAIQSLGFLVAAVIYEILAAILFTGLSIVTGGCLACILWILFLVPVVPALYYAWKAYKGQYFKIPFLTDFMVSSKWLEIPTE
jgi:uncharacterized membrane protein